MIGNSHAGIGGEFGASVALNTVALNTVALNTVALKTPARLAWLTAARQAFEAAGFG